MQLRTWKPFVIVYFLCASILMAFGGNFFQAPILGEGAMARYHYYYSSFWVEQIISLSRGIKSMIYLDFVHFMWPFVYNACVQCYKPSKHYCSAVYMAVLCTQVRQSEIKQTEKCKILKVIKCGKQLKFFFPFSKSGRDRLRMEWQSIAWHGMAGHYIYFSFVLLLKFNLCCAVLCIVCGNFWIWLFVICHYGSIPVPWTNRFCSIYRLPLYIHSFILIFDRHLKL